MDNHIICLCNRSNIHNNIVTNNQRIANLILLPEPIYHVEYFKLIYIFFYDDDIYSILHTLNG